WPSWSPGVSTAALAGPVASGSTFKWKSGRNTIKSELVKVDAPSAISWTGRTTGIKALHAWQLEERDGATIVRTQESWHGLVVKLLRHTIQPTLQSAIDDGLVALKTASERPSD
ncbi:MAG TPA: SRPBCC family protein, partial [Acidimicrobiia bacterium]|nr:SRPBCC family protein [Acidimicrobiia bacterium]